MTTRTPEDRIATREAALLRYVEGYPLPETSVTEGKWTPEFDEYATAVRESFCIRYTDCYRVGVDYAEYQRAELDFRLMEKAVLEKKPLLIETYSRLLRDSLHPTEIEPALHVFGSINRSGTLAHEHVNVYYDLQETLYEWRATRRLGGNGPPAEFLGDLVNLCFEEMSEQRLFAVKAILARGITSGNEIRTGLETFNGIESPLKDGAL